MPPHMIDRTGYAGLRRVERGEEAGADTVRSGTSASRDAEGAGTLPTPDAFSRYARATASSVQTGRLVTAMPESTSRAPSRTTGTPTSVYRYYDPSGLLIYVGITSRGMRRNAEHNRDKGWWPYVASQEVDHYGTRAEALRRERSLIMQHRPPFNRQHNPDSESIRTTYIAYASTAIAGNPLDAWRAARKRITFKMREVQPALKTFTLVNDLASTWLARHIRSGDEFPIFNTRGRNLDVLGGVEVLSAGLDGMSYAIILRASRPIPPLRSAFARVRVVSMKDPMTLRVATLNCEWEPLESRQAREATGEVA